MEAAGDRLDDILQNKPPSPSTPTKNEIDGISSLLVSLNDLYVDDGRKEVSTIGRWYEAPPHDDVHHCIFVGNKHSHYSW